MQSDLTDIINSVFLTFDKREDSYLQQYSRVVMVKVFFAASIATWYKWQPKDMTCNVLGNSSYKTSIVPQVCWNQGVYVYKELRDSKFYGIPDDLEFNGKYENGTLCKINSTIETVDGSCKRLTKVYFKQYQYIYLILLLISVIYWLPYWIFELIESDIISLKHHLDSMQQVLISQDCKFNKKPLEKEQLNCDLSDIKIKRYFHTMIKIKETMKSTKLKEAAKIIKVIFFATPCEKFPEQFKTKLDDIREPCKIIFRLCYAAINLIPLFLIDYVYDGHFLSYGVNWMKWDQVQLQYNEHLGKVFLPIITFCDIHKVVNIEYDIIDRSKLTCEVSKHAYCQYVFLLLWIAIFIGFIIAPLDAVIDLVELGKTYRKYFRINKIKIKDESHNIFELEKKMKEKNIQMNMRRIRYFLLIKESNEQLLEKVLDEIFEEGAVTKQKRKRKRRMKEYPYKDKGNMTRKMAMEEKQQCNERYMEYGCQSASENTKAMLRGPSKLSRPKKEMTLMTSRSPPSIFSKIEEEEENIELENIRHSIIGGLGGCVAESLENINRDPSEDIEGEHHYLLPSMEKADREDVKEHQSDEIGKKSASEYFMSK